MFLQGLQKAVAARIRVHAVFVAGDAGESPVTRAEKFFGGKTATELVVESHTVTDVGGDQPVNDDNRAGGGADLVAEQCAVRIAVYGWNKQEPVYVTSDEIAHESAFQRAIVVGIRDEQLIPVPPAFRFQAFG